MDFEILFDIWILKFELMIKICFFGTPDYSLIVLEKLYQGHYPIVVIVTKPPRPNGRSQILTPTPVAVWAKKNNLPLLTPAANSDKPWLFLDEAEMIKEIRAFQPELLISADYTQMIPQALVNQVKYHGLNVHPSLLPAYRGPAPVPWAIANGENETGVSIVTLSEKFDEGQVIAQEKEKIQSTDTTDMLLKRLFKKGAELLIQVLTPPNLLLLRGGSEKSRQSNPPLGKRGGGSYYPRMTRNTGFEPWENIKHAIESGTEAARIERKWRAFHPWPGLWTKVRVNSDKRKEISEIRLKLLKVHLSLITSHLSPTLILDEIQLEGKQILQKTDVTIFLHRFI